MCLGCGVSRTFWLRFVYYPFWILLHFDYLGVLDAAYRDDGFGVDKPPFDGFPDDVGSDEVHYRGLLDEAEGFVDARLDAFVEFLLDLEAQVLLSERFAQNLGVADGQEDLPAPLPHVDVGFQARLFRPASPLTRI